MRFQGTKASTTLFLWFETHSWVRLPVDTEIRFSSQEHALLGRDGKALAAYEPRFEAWFAGEERLRGIRIEAMDGLLLWTQRGRWECMGSFAALFFDCAQQALCDRAGVARLFYYASRNVWAPIHPAFSQQEIQMLSVTAMGKRPS